MIKKVFFTSIGRGIKYTMANARSGINTVLTATATYAFTEVKTDLRSVVASRIPMISIDTGVVILPIRETESRRPALLPTMRF